MATTPRAAPSSSGGGPTIGAHSLRGPKAAAWKVDVGAATARRRPDRSVKTRNASRVARLHVVNAGHVDHIRRVVVGLGSNVGDRVSNIQEALGRLAGDEHIHVTERSPLYETAPVGGVEQGDFINGAVLLLTALEASELMQRLLAVETSLGRVRDVKNGPRTIDLDILWIEGETVNEPDLVVPHPRLVERSFMLRPLVDLASDAIDPVSGKPFAELDLAKVALKRVD